MRFEKRQHQAKCLEKFHEQLNIIVESNEGYGFVFGGEQVI